MALLECKNLVKVYPGGKRAVRDVSFHVEKGEIVALLGPNGAGKSTTFSMSVGLISPTEGQVLLNGRDVTHWAMYRRARAGMGYLPQYHSIFVKLTVEQNLQAILEFLPLSYEDRMQRINKLIDQFGLEGQRPIRRLCSWTSRSLELTPRQSMTSRTSSSSCETAGYPCC